MHPIAFFSFGFSLALVLIAGVYSFSPATAEAGQRAECEITSDAPDIKTLIEKMTVLQRKPDEIAKLIGGLK